MRRLLLQQSQWFKKSPRVIKGIYWEAGLFLRTPFTEGCVELTRKPRPLAVNNVALLAPLCSVQFSSGVKIIYYRIWSRDVFWLGSPAPIDRC